MAPAKRVSEIDWKRWRAVDLCTLVFAIEGERVLLIRKKRGLGAGKINGPGGKLEAGETALSCAVRETREELGIEVRDLVHLGELSFEFADGYSTHVYVYRADAYDGEPIETAEAIPLWHEVAAMPYDEMWEDDRYWLPLMFAGDSFRGRFLFDGDALVDYTLDRIDPTELTTPEAG